MYIFGHFSYYKLWKKGNSICNYQSISKIRNYHKLFQVTFKEVACLTSADIRHGNDIKIINKA